MVSLNKLANEIDDLVARSDAAGSSEQIRRRPRKKEVGVGADLMSEEEKEISQFIANFDR